MGYTQYQTQKRSFTSDEWREVTADIREILSYVENMLGVPLGNGMGESGTRPDFNMKEIMFNGIGDDAHETFVLHRVRCKEYEGGTLGWSCTKTARKPYDVAVTACLCYLASVTETHTVSSDGQGSDFMLGLDAARKALSRKANVLDIPIDIMREDRWTGPWVNHRYGSKYEARFCVDGHGYIEKGNEKAWYRFDTHLDLARFLDANKYASFARGGNTGFGSYPAHEPDIWKAYGSFDAARHARIAKAQNKVLSKLFPVDAAHDFPPPAFIRPGDMITDAEFHYSLSDLLNKIAA